MAFKVPTLPVWMNPNFRRVSYDEKGLLQDAEPPMYGPEVPPGFVPPTPQTVASTSEQIVPPAPDETTEVAQEPDEFGGVEKDTKMALMEYIRGKLGKKDEGSVFDRPEAQKANMALYYAGLGKELPASYFEKAETDDSKRLNSAVGALNALRSMKGKNNEVPGDRDLKFHLALKQTDPKLYEQLGGDKAVGLYTQKQIMDQRLISHGGRHLGLREASYHLSMDMFDEKKRQNLIQNGFSRERIDNDIARIAQSGAVKASEFIGMRDRISQMKNLFPGQLSTGDLVQELSDAGITTWEALKAAMPKGVGRRLNSQQVNMILAAKQGLENEITRVTSGLNVTEQERASLKAELMSELVDDPVLFFQQLPNIEARINNRIQSITAIPGALAPDLMKRAGYEQPVSAPKQPASGKKVLKVVEKGGKKYKVYAVDAKGNATDYEEIP